MSTSSNNADSLLVMDIGAVHTRAMLFDVVDGKYRFIAAGTAPTTVGAPFRDIGEGVRIAIDQLQSITGRNLVGPDEHLIMPSKGDGSGVDTFAATLSAGPPLRVVAVGLLESISLESARRLAASTYSNVMETISLNDRRKPETRIDMILRIRPDLIVVAGGTEGGAAQSVLQLLESVGLACYLMPDEQRPEVLFAGNQDLHEEVQSNLEKIANLHFAPNVRPNLDVEQFEAGQSQIAEIYGKIRGRHVLGVADLNNWAGGGLMPTATAFGRIIRFLSKAHASAKGVLGIDVSASATSLAAAFSGDLALGVYPQFGLGRGLSSLLENVSLNEIMQWLAIDIPAEQVREYIFNKSLYPASLPVMEEDLAIEQALARTAMNCAVRLMAGSFSPKAVYSGPGLLPWVEPILATGSVLTRAPGLAHATLMLLDGLQPTGATTLVLDQNHLSPALGVAAAINPILAVQVLDSNAFLHLGTVISPVGNGRPGMPVLRLKMTYESGHEIGLDVKHGSLEVLPLSVGQSARLQLQPLQRYDIGMGGPGRSGGLRVVGGALGVIIDARGRPLQLPEDPGRRQELFKKWLWTLGG